MKEQEFSEKDSLELISQMIKQSKKKMEVGQGNIYLYYGYAALILSFIVYTLTEVFSNGIWSMLWLLMFVPYSFMVIKRKKEKPQVITYIDKAIDNTWKVVGSLFGLTFFAIIVVGLFTGKMSFILMMPLSLLYVGIGESITGVITKSKMLVYTPLVAFIFAIYMLTLLTINGQITNYWNLYFGLSFIVMMIIPGHILNKKTEK